MSAQSIRNKGIERHVNEYAENRGIKYRYADIVYWRRNGIVGERGERIKASKAWIRRQFAGVSAPVFDKWWFAMNEREGLK